MSQHTVSAFLLFKGATRIPTVAGVPMVPLLTMGITIAAVAMVVSLKAWFLALPSWLIMRQITRADEQAFRIWWLWLITKGRNSKRLNNQFWNASSYSKTDYRWRSRGNK